MPAKMTPKQMKARNEAFQLLSIAHRILGEVGLTAYAHDVGTIRDEMAADAKALVTKEIDRRLPSVAP